MENLLEISPTVSLLIHIIRILAMFQNYASFILLILDFSQYLAPNMRGLWWFGFYLRLCMIAKGLPSGSRACAIHAIPGTCCFGFVIVPPRLLIL